MGRPCFDLAHILTDVMAGVLDFVLDWAKNGELQSLISRMGSLSTECSRYYSAQIIDAVHYMHDNGIIHRCLKLRSTKVTIC